MIRLVWHPPPHNNRTALIIHVFNVHHGDCILIELPLPPSGPRSNSHRKYIIVDTKNRWEGWIQSYIDEFIGFTQPNGSKEFICGVITHGHRDHRVGFLDFARIHLQNKNVYVPPPHPSTTESYSTLLEELETARAHINYIQDGHSIIDDEEISIKFIGPTQNTIDEQSIVNTNDAVNNFSLVMHIKYGSAHIILAGDAETESWDDMKDLARLPSQFTLLKVAHHGSSNGSPQDMIRDRNPRASVISASGQYGLPDPNIVRMISNGAGRYLFSTMDEVGSYVQNPPLNARQADFQLVSYVYCFDLNATSFRVYQVITGVNVPRLVTRQEYDRLFHVILIAP